MIAKERKPIYSMFEIRTILFYATMIMFLPIILVFTYILDIDTLVDINLFVIYILIANGVILIAGTIGLIVRKDHLKRIVKANYQVEFVYLAVITIFGLLGFIVLFDYANGNRDYIANILVVLFVILLYVLIFLGRKFFKFDYMKKK